MRRNRIESRGTLLRMKQALDDNTRALLFAAEHDESVPVLDLHGMSEHDALRELDLVLDRAFYAGEKVIKIIHGSGTGKLREAVRTALTQHPFVKTSSPASPPLDSGVTIAVLESGE